MGIERSMLGGMFAGESLGLEMARMGWSWRGMLSGVPKMESIANPIRCFARLRFLGFTAVGAFLILLCLQKDSRKKRSAVRFFVFSL